LLAEEVTAQFGILSDVRERGEKKVIYIYENR
jgi:hypothetical protein